MTYDEKLRSKPEETNDHDQSDNLNRQLADLLARARDAGMDVDSERADLSDNDRRDMLRAHVARICGKLPSVVNAHVDTRRADDRIQQGS